VSHQRNFKLIFELTPSEKFFIEECEDNNSKKASIKNRIEKTDTKWSCY
jgi:hypothetical protein